MITLAAGETATWTINTDAGKDAYRITVATSGIWIGTRAGSTLEIDAVERPSGGVLIDRLDASFGSRTGLAVTPNVHVNDLLYAHPGDGLKIVDVTVEYTDGTSDSFQQDITVDRVPSGGFAFFLQNDPYGGYVRYYDVSSEAERVLLDYPDGTSDERDVPATPDGLLWIERSDEPSSVRLVDTAGNTSGNVLAGTRRDAFAPPATDLVPWALPPYIDPIAAGFGALLRAVERSLNLEPESAGELASPTSTRGRYLDAIGTLFGVTRGASERDSDLRKRVFAAIRRGKATPEGLTAILTDLFSVPVQVVDANDDATIPAGTFHVYLFAEPPRGLTAAAEVVRAYRAAGFAPTLSLSFEAPPTVPVSARWAGPHEQILETDQTRNLARRYQLDGTWTLGDGIPLFANLFTQITTFLDTGVYLHPLSSPTRPAILTVNVPADLDALTSVTTVGMLAANAAAVTYDAADVTYGGALVTFGSEPISTPAILHPLAATVAVEVLTVDVAAADLAGLAGSASVAAATVSAALTGSAITTAAGSLGVTAPPIGLDGLASATSVAALGAGPTVWLHDTFTEASDTPLENHAPDVTPNAATWGLGVIDENTELSVITALGGIQQDVDASIETLALWPDVLPNADARVEATVNFNGTLASGSDRIGLMLRADNTASSSGGVSGYMLRVNADGSARVDRYDAGVNNYLDGVSTGTIDTNQDIDLEFRVEGSTLTAYANGSLIATVVDATYAAAGYFRLKMYDVPLAYVKELKILT